MTEEEIAAAAQVAAETAAETPPPAAPDYAKLFEQQRAQNAILQQQIQQQMVNQQQILLQQQQNTQQSTTQADPFAAFEPETAKAMRAVADNLQANFAKQTAQLQAQLASAQVAAVTTNLPPAIAGRAKAIFEAMSAKGIPLTAEDSRRFAIGEAIEAGTYSPGQPSQQTQTRQPPAVLPGGSRQPVTKARPANFDNLSWQEQKQIMIANGIENEEF